MNNIYTHNQSLQKNTNNNDNKRSANNRDIYEFTSVLDSLSEDRSGNERDNNRFSVEYLTPFGKISTEYIIEKKTDNIGALSNALENNACNNKITHNDLTSQNVSRFNTVSSINELSRMFENILLKSVNNSESKWQFTYIDSSLGRLNMSVNKESQNNISIIISSLNVNKNDMRRLTHQLHSRLINKGWVNQISKASDAYIKDKSGK
jgi:hypothetical protein